VALQAGRQVRREGTWGFWVKVAGRDTGEGGEGGGGG
jgi:hypothetical protein